jgi:hypothetical protein
MAVTYTASKEGVMGDIRYSMGALTLTSVSSGAVAIPGIKRLYAAQVSLRTTAATAPSYTVVINAESGGTATNGYLEIVNGVASDVFEVLAFGE